MQATRAQGQDVISDVAVGCNCLCINALKVIQVKFYILLTTHLCIILCNDQLDAQLLFCVCLFQFSTRFKHSSAHHEEIQLYQ